MGNFGMSFPQTEKWTRDPLPPVNSSFWASGIHPVIGRGDTLEYALRRLTADAVKTAIPRFLEQCRTVSVLHGPRGISG